MANKVLKGTGVVASKDFKDSVKWIGKTKAGEAVQIIVYNAINKENINWALQEKSEVIQTATYEGCYLDADLEKGDLTEPWDVTFLDSTKKGERDATQIVLGLGKFYIGDTYVGLTRGGGTFVVERAFRDIVADGDPGTVVDRVSLDESRPKLTMNLLQILGNMEELFTAVSVNDENAAATSVTNEDEE